MPREIDDIMAEWRGIEARVLALAEKCRLNPEEALLLGVEPAVERIDRREPFNRQTSTAPVNVRAGWIRGAAKVTISEEWLWEVQEMIGGGAALILLGHEPKEPEIRPREFPP